MATETNEKELTPIRQMIDHAMNKRYSKVSTIFKELVGDKINKAVDIKKAEIGANVFAGNDSE